MNNKDNISNSVGKSRTTYPVQTLKHKGNLPVRLESGPQAQHGQTEALDGEVLGPEEVGRYEDGVLRIEHVEQGE